jgi:MFS family permease
MEIAMSLGVYITRKLPASVSSDKIIYTGIFLVGVSAIVGAVTKSFVPVLIAILVIEAATMALGYVFSNMVQAEITELGYGEAGGENNMRATLLSSVSTSVTIGAMFCELTYGYSATSLGISMTWLISGILVTALAVLVYLLTRQRQVTVTPQTEGAA